jgi:hypothetical protein
MTLQELSDYAQIQERLDQDEEILLSLQQAAYPAASKLSGMPRVHGYRDKIGDLGVEIADMRSRIQFLRETLAEKEGEITEYIKGVPDDRMRVIMRLRFVRCLTWGEVAHVLGGGNTEDGVKSSCYRFLHP